MRRAALLSLLALTFVGPSVLGCTISDESYVSPLVADDCPSEEVDYADCVQPLLAAKCNACHSGDSPIGGISFDPVPGGQLARPGVLTACDANASSFYGRLIVGADSPLLMPQGGPPLSANEIDLIGAWINEGAGGTFDPAACP